MSTQDPALRAAAQHILQDLRARRPDLESCVPDLLALHGALITCYDRGGCLYTCGNGGSHADAIHIVGELVKSFERRRPLDPAFVAALEPLQADDPLCTHLEGGLRAMTLGLNSALKTAVENDCAHRDIAFAQEAHVMLRPGDVLLALSTSGNSRNCLMALRVARARGAATAAMTGPGGGAMAAAADVVVRAPGTCTKVIQEAHIALWHAMCSLIEAHYFPAPR